MFHSQKFAVIGGTGHHDLDMSILKKVNEIGHSALKFIHLDYDLFPDLEPDVRIPDGEKMKDKHLLLFQSTYSLDLVNEFLDLAGAAKNKYGARSIMAILPFMYFRRQDPPEEKNEIDRFLWFIQQMKANSIKYLITCDIHNKKALDENCNREGIMVWNVDPTPVYANALKIHLDFARDEGRELYVYAPDEGSIPRAINLAKELDAKMAVTPKKRHHDLEIEIKEDLERIEKLQSEYEIEIILADKRLEGSVVVMREDELETGVTAKKTGKRLKKEIKAHKVFFCVTHPVCAPTWKRKLIDHNPFDDIFMGNTIPRDYKKKTGGKITTIDMSGIIGQQLFKVMCEIE